LTKAAAVIILTVILYLYSGLTINRNLDWVSDYALWSKTVNQSPSSVRAHNNLGVAYAEKGAFKEASTEYMIALRYGPQSQSAYFNMGNRYRDMGLLDLAISSYEKALMINPQNTSVLNNLGNVYSTAGMFDLAIDVYNKALRINPGDSQLRFNLEFTKQKKVLLDHASPEYSPVQ
jgi:tetratricopeptide (TPR) repeat protein